jgi:hypothetical protein
VLKLKKYKGTWNQASRIQVRGGLLGYKVKVLLEYQSTAGSQSTANQVKVLLLVEGLLCKLFKD